MNPYLIGATILFMAVDFFGGAFAGYEYRSLKVPAELHDQQKADQTECDKSQKLTKDENYVLQKNRNDIADKLAALQLQHPAACVPVSKPPNVPTSGAKHAGQNGAGPSTGLDTSWLRTYAAEAEQYRSSLSVCTDFLTKERSDVQ